MRNRDQVERDAVHPCALVPVPQVLAGLLRGAAMTAPLDRERLVRWMTDARAACTQNDAHWEAAGINSVIQAMQHGHFDSAPSVPCEALRRALAEFDGVARVTALIQAAEAGQ